MLVDSPIEAGLFRDASILAAGRRHTYALWPETTASDENVARLLDATKSIVETEASLFGGELPHEGYTFLLHFASRGRGGLEHLASSALIAPETSFDTREGMLDLLSLISHEYFHLWNVKRLRPAGLTPYRYEEENYTRLLWWFEGATSYFDWRVLRLAKLCTVDEYLDHLAGEIAYIEGTPGRWVHPLEAASFDAWIKLYRPDENSPNSTISYYRKGEIVNAMFDLEIRARSAGKSSLDAVLLHLWRTHGAQGIPVPEDAMPKLFAEATGLDLSDLFARLVTSTKDMDIDATFRPRRPGHRPCSQGGSDLQHGDAREERGRTRVRDGRPSGMRSAKGRPRTRETRSSRSEGAGSRAASSLRSSASAGATSCQSWCPATVTSARSTSPSTLRGSTK